MTHLVHACSLCHHPGEGPKGPRESRERLASRQWSIGCYSLRRKAEIFLPSVAFLGHMTDTRTGVRGTNRARRWGRRRGIAEARAVEEWSEGCFLRWPELGVALCGATPERLLTDRGAHLAELLRGGLPQQRHG